MVGEQGVGEPSRLSRKLTGNAREEEIAKNMGKKRSSGASSAVSNEPSSGRKDPCDRMLDRRSLRKEGRARREGNVLLKGDWSRKKRNLENSGSRKRQESLTRKTEWVEQAGAVINPHGQR